MSVLRVGMIGCGRPVQTAGATGFGMAHLHALGYAKLPATKIVALSDISEDNARAFQAQHGGDAIYSNYEEMLSKENLDIVSICTWPHLHRPMVEAAARAGVRAIHCEKPIATSYGDSKQMVQLCSELGVQLTFNHQRRFNEPFRKAKELLKSGAIGELIRLEASAGNLFDWGTHWFDMMFFYNDETPVDWVIGQIDLRDGEKIFGFQLEGQGLSHFKFRNGVHGLLVTGADTGWEADNRLIGTDGAIEVNPVKGQQLRIWGKGQSGWEDVPTSDHIHNTETAIPLGIADLVDALQTGREPELSARRALQATELIFATYESSRRRARVDLPLDVDDSALAALQAAAGM